MGEVGRPTKLTPEVQEKILQALRAGNYAHVAAQYAGIHEATFYRWMQQGEQEPEGEYREFREAVMATTAAAEVRAVAHIQQAMPEDWKAAATFLERRYPDRWGRRNAPEAQQQGAGKIVIREVVVHLPSGEAQESEPESEGDVILTLPAGGGEDV